MKYANLPFQGPVCVSYLQYCMNKTLPLVYYNVNKHLSLSQCDFFFFFFFIYLQKFLCLAFLNFAAKILGNNLRITQNIKSSNRVLFQLLFHSNTQQMNSRMKYWGENCQATIFTAELSSAVNIIMYFCKSSPIVKVPLNAFSVNSLQVSCLRCWQIHL